MNYNQTFQEAFLKLNPSQKQAVSNIEGPVMVIAGPGTGKTQVIAARIGYILQKTDSQPHHILCLTYTDAATVAMRKRLIEFIGPTAYNIQIYTFHAFCNLVIQDNLTFFGGYRDLQPITDLEKMELMENMIDNLAKDHPLKRLTGDRYYEQSRLSKLFELMKKENWTSEYIVNRVDQYIAEIPFMDKFLYKRNLKARGIKAGDPKQKDINKEVKKMEELKSAALLFDEYNRRLKDAQRYDFHDMIVWVLDAFKNNEDLLADYREQFLYILVDEYQDTNGAQNDLLYQLTSFWEAPNIFVVGDDDQSIYRFQGANTQNILQFKKRFEGHLKEIVLTQNYRSTQAILDAARSLITKGDDRLENEFPYLSKHLTAAGEIQVGPLPQLTNYINTDHENADLVQKLTQWHAEGKDLSQVAVIYRSHKQVAEIVKALEKKGVPLQLKRRINILEDFWIHRILQICRYISLEIEKPYSGEHLLPELMHYSFFNIHPLDIAKIARYCAYKIDEKDSYKRWNDVLQDDKALFGLHLKEIKEVKKFRNNLNEWIKAYHNETVQVQLEQILTYSGILAEMLQSSEKAWMMQMLTTFFNLIKEESRRFPFMKLSEVTNILDKMLKYDLSLPIQRTYRREKGVHFLTAHSSKGLEFKHVIILGANTNNWEGKRSGNHTYSIPDTIMSGNEEHKVDDERRLFYVAMTRAEVNLEINYSHTNEKGKNLQESRFVVEMIGDEVLQPTQKKDNPKSLEDEAMIQYDISRLLDQPEIEYPWIDKDIVDEVLEKFQMSVTSLNKYLQCPISFYFENILRVPSARTVHTGFGNAIHLTLERMHNIFKEKGAYPTTEKVLEIFEEKMKHLHSHFTAQEYEDRMAYGKMILPEYIKKYKSDWPRITQFTMEYNIANAICEEVPIKGRLDRVEVEDNKVRVIDYKTGKVDRGKSKSKGPKDSEDPGGDYWRQMVFYKLLIDNDPRQNWKWNEGAFDFIQPDKRTEEFSLVKIDVSDEDEKLVKEQLVNSWNRINNYEFEKGCDDEYCKWCQFLKYNTINTTGNEDDEGEDPLELDFKE